MKDTRKKLAELGRARQKVIDKLAQEFVGKVH
jgi:hypothetical protein